MFTSARLTLTGWYFLIIVAISGSLSALYYVRTVRILNIEYSRIEKKLLHNPIGNLVYPPPEVVHDFLYQDLAQAKRSILLQLLIIDGGIVTVSTALAYLLATKTLAPIQKAVEEQKRFIGDAAHELKTPIAALKTSLEVNLLTEKLTPNVKTILNENLEDVSQLEKLTESLISLARIEDKTMKFQKLALAPILFRAVKTVTPLAKKKKIKIEVSNVSESIELHSEETMLFDLLIIFLDNAIKYSQEKTTIQVAVSKKQNQVLIKIIDQGVGIAESDLSHIFDRFYRADKSRTHVMGASGFGLGLSLAQKIMDAHRGHIKVTSTLNQGTTFTLIFPV